MTEYRVISNSGTPGLCRYRLIDGEGNEIKPLNQFLDATAIRGLSERTLRTYAYALLSLWKWMGGASLSINGLTELHLADYIRHLREDAEKTCPPAPRSINLRLQVARSLYRFCTQRELPKAAGTPIEAVPIFVQPSRIGTRASPRLGRPALRVKVPRHLVVPLKREEVQCFFESFRTHRDLALAGLMLFSGLRSREVLSLHIKDMGLLQEEMRVYGKGDKDRVLPLAPYVRSAVAAYLELERPETDHDYLFVNLKGPSRGSPMTAAGLREIFRYHRKRSGVQKANPHRLRHTFAADMVREGMSLPVLMRLMGHSSIEMTMRYINLSAEDVRAEFERAVRRLAEEWPNGRSMPRDT